MTTKEKKKLLVCLIEKYVQNGYCILDFIAKPLSHFDYDKIKESIKEFEDKEQEEMNEY